MIRTVLIFLLIAAMPAWSDDSIDTKALATLPHATIHAPNFVASGQPKAEDIATIAAAGIRDVIDLTEDSETPGFDEASAVKAAGMRYHNLPIHGAKDLTADNIRRFDRLIAEAGASPTLVHCASGNRVGALIALRAATLQGKPVDAALQEGRDWGLKSLEPAVRERLATVTHNTKMGTVPAASSLQFPRIQSAGGVYAMPRGVDMPATDQVHRLLIDAHESDTTETGTNRSLETAARAVNLYALAKVPPANVKIVVLLHGKATPLSLSDSSYRGHFSRSNPDAALIAKLHGAGVEFFVCGQALTHQGYAITDVRNEVRVTLSAITKLVELQAAGYGVIP
jgi:uncharacterized protein (TIGR01244 family)